MYKTIFTYLASPKTAGLVAELAAYLADKHKAHLIGAHNSGRISIYGGVPSDVLSQHNFQQREMAEGLEKTFEAAAAPRNLSREWRHKSLADTEVFPDLIAQARTADLVIACANDDSDPLSSFHDVPVRLALETGRPVLLVPAKGTFTTIGERITIAWNHSRESTRAVFDALPLLRAAGTVEILAVNSTKDAATDPGKDITDALMRHGVNAKSTVASTTHSEGAELLKTLAANNSDMLVMGCYGHSRLREMVLGGVTQHVMKHMTMPVLMAH